MTAGLLDEAMARAKQAEQDVLQFAEMTGCTVREAWEHYELTLDQRFVLPDNPATRH